MEQNLDELLLELKTNPRNISPDEVQFIFDELIKAMISSGYETEVTVKLKFFFDAEGKPFIQATVPQSISPISLYIGDILELGFDDGVPLLADEAIRKPAKHQTPPLINPDQEVTLFNTLINFPVMCITGLYDQIKYEYFKDLFLGSSSKKEKNEIIRKIRDRAENNLYRATLGQPDLFVGRSEKSSEEIRLEKEKFLSSLFYAFENWQNNQKSKKYTKSKGFPTQSDVSELIAFPRKIINPRKKLSIVLKLYKLEFKQLWKIYSENKNLDDFLSSVLSPN